VLPPPIVEVNEQQRGIIAHTRIVGPPCRVLVHDGVERTLFPCGPEFQHVEGRAARGAFDKSHLCTVIDRAGEVRMEPFVPDCAIRKDVLFSLPGLQEFLMDRSYHLISARSGH
jgi:hypothetical protein